MKSLLTHFATFFLTSFFIFIVSTGMYATVWTVSNNPNSPGQYTSLQMAVDSSGIGDTILVAGSTTNYGEVDIYWQLTIIGAGIHNPYGSNTTVETIYLRNFSASVQSSGTKLSGLAFEPTTYPYNVGGLSFYGGFSGGNASNQMINDVIVERCSFSGNSSRNGGIFFNGHYTGEVSYSNDTIRNCIFSCYYYESNSYNTSNVYFDDNGVYDTIVFHNNIFEDSDISCDNTPSPGQFATVFFKNNLFLDRTDNGFVNIKEIVLENNIFYNHAPQGCSQCTFNNNLTYQNGDNNIPYGDNTGSGNFVDTDPEFVDYPFYGGAFDWSHDFHLLGTSPIINQGTDGSDIGLYGGLMPVEFGLNPAIPQMMELNIPESSVPVGGSFNVNFKVRKQD